MCICYRDIMFKKLFIPSDDSDLTNMALLVARLWLGLTMLFNHGLEKLFHFGEFEQSIQDPLRLGSQATLILVVLAEVAGSLLLAVGLLTRIAAAVLVIDMFVAFLMVNRTTLQGEGELAFLYLSGFVFLLIAGGGLFSLDTLVFKKSSFNQLPKNN
jgi:putative oxidoreductase